MIDFEEVRRVAIIALFSDDVLFDKLVLKGGNALRLVYGFGSRSSLDIDVSIEEDFIDLNDISQRLLRALTRRFELAGFYLFDFSFRPKPSNQIPGDRWGGYQLLFKLIEMEKHRAFRGDLETIRRNASVLGPAQMRNFTVDMSKYEYCVGKREVEMDGFSMYVYTPAMIAVEKLRAICQQMEAYQPRKNRQARARDFYDIHLIVVREKLDFAAAEVRELIPPIFGAKEVSVGFLKEIEAERDFHRLDWPAVQASVLGSIEAFDFYFDFVIRQLERLETFRIE